MASLPNFNALLTEGFNAGREMKRQEGVRNALADLMTENPGQTPGYGDGSEVNRRAPSALADLARYDPQMAFQIQDHRQKRELEQQKLNVDRDERRQKLLGEGKKAVGQAALQIAQLPEAQRPQAWDQAIDYLVGQGWDGLAQYKGKYNPQSLMGVISEAGLANDLRQATQPSYQVVAADADLVNTRDPAALQQFAVKRGQGEPQQTATPPSAPAGGNFADFNGGITMLKSLGPQGFIQWQQQNNVPVQVAGPEQAAALPVGTIMMSPDGRVGVKH